MPEFWSNVMWYTLTIIIFVSYLFALLTIFSDLFRDRQLSGGMKAVWVVFLIFFPLITALVYLIVRGGGMAGRAQAQAEKAKEATDDYIRSVAGSPATRSPAPSRCWTPAPSPPTSTSS